MALISCPECGKQISDTTPACPHCGYAFSTIVTDSPSISPTKIGETKKRIGMGILMMTIGIFGMIGSLFLFAFIIGIFSMIGSLAIFSVGWQNLSGVQEVYCPYCGKLGSISRSAQNYKCPVCRKHSVRDGEYLKPV